MNYSCKKVYTKGSQSALGFLTQELQRDETQLE
jgi:hypothetical protein